MMGVSSEDFDRHLHRLLSSYQRLLGKPLFELSAEQGLSEYLDQVDFVLLSHGTEDDPLFNYANRSALDLFGMRFDEFCGMPSRYSAEQPNREERAALLRQVNEQGYIDNYHGVRIAKDGRRFLIEQAVVWNVYDEAGTYCGQAATFSTWRELPPALFAYGTLMCHEIMQQVSGMSALAQPACLSGYKRFLVKGEDYPAVVEAAASEVTGVLYDNLSEEAWRRLDDFEGDEYRRESVKVITDDGTQRVAQVYVFKDCYQECLSECEWSYDAFINDGGRERFEAKYRGYKLLTEL